MGDVAVAAGAAALEAAAAACLLLAEPAVELARRRFLPVDALSVVGVSGARVAEVGVSLSPGSASSSSFPFPEMERPPGTLAAWPPWPDMLIGLEERPMGVPTGIEDGS